jgi:hypothetical protein
MVTIGVSGVFLFFLFAGTPQGALSATVHGLSDVPAGVGWTMDHDGRGSNCLRSKRESGRVGRIFGSGAVARRILHIWPDGDPEAQI